MQEDFSTQTTRIPSQQHESLDCSETEKSGKLFDMGLCSEVFTRRQKKCLLGWQAEIAKTRNREVHNM